MLVNLVIVSGVKVKFTIGNCDKIAVEIKISIKLFAMHIFVYKVCN